MDPEHAVQAHLDLGADTLLPVHWATFNLACYAWVEPIERTLAAAKVQGVRVVTPAGCQLSGLGAVRLPAPTTPAQPMTASLASEPNS